MGYEEGGNSEKLVRLRRQAVAREYLNGPAANAYLDKHLSRSWNIDVLWMDYTGYPVYRQSHCQPFFHEVSVMDLIFVEGVNGARKHMLSFGAKPSVRRQSIWHRLSYFLRDTFLPVLSPV